VIIDRRINPSGRAKSERQAGERRVKIFASAALYIPLARFRVTAPQGYFAIIQRFAEEANRAFNAVFIKRMRV
jgi:hypothetical protein